MKIKKLITIFMISVFVSIVSFTTVLAQETEDIIDIDLIVNQDDSVIENWITLTEGIRTNYHRDRGDYSLEAVDINNNIVWNQTLDIYFGYNGPMFIGVDYSSLDYTSYYLTFRTPYSPNMHKLLLYHKDAAIFSKILNFCNNNGVCDISETYESCPVDCPLDKNDIICLPEPDGVCDPDCGQGVDPDCVEEFYPNAGPDKEVFVGDEVSFHGEVTNPGMVTYTYEWFFEDDGSTETGQDVIHLFKEEGVYATELTVTNQEGVSKTDTLLVTVTVTPKYLKRLSLKKLESVKTDCVYKWWQWWRWLFDKKCKQNKIIDHIVGRIDSSLRSYLWVDDWRLSDKHSEKVFMDEYEAVKYMMAKKKLVSEEIKIVFEWVINNLVSADKLIARTAIEDAKITPIVNPENQEKVNRELIAAEDEFYKAEQSTTQEKFDKAILHYKKAWEHAQLAIKFAKKEKEKCWLWWKCKEKREEEKEEKISVIDAWGRLLEKVGGGYTKR